MARGEINPSVGRTRAVEPLPNSLRYFDKDIELRYIREHDERVSRADRTQTIVSDCVDSGGKGQIPAIQMRFWWIVTLPWVPSRRSALAHDGAWAIAKKLTLRLIKSISRLRACFSRSNSADLI